MSFLTCHICIDSAKFECIKMWWHFYSYDDIICFFLLRIDVETVYCLGCYLEPRQYMLPLCLALLRTDVELLYCLCCCSKPKQYLLSKTDILWTERSNSFCPVTRTHPLKLYVPRFHFSPCRRILMPQFIENWCRTSILPQLLFRAEAISPAFMHWFIENWCRAGILPLLLLRTETVSLARTRHLLNRTF